MKKNILFIANSYGRYMGGVYYIKNMIYSLTQCEEACRDFNIYILVSADNSEVYRNLERNNKNITLIHAERRSILKRLYSFLSFNYYVRIRKKIISQNIDALLVKKYKIDVIYPLYEDVRFQEKGILWIPDFQHFYYPEFFPGNKLEERNETYTRYIELANIIVLSSKSAKKDYTIRFGHLKKKVFVVPFVSQIEKKDYLYNSKEVKKKFNVPDKYFLVSNQFYAHKDHLTVFRALKRIKDQGRKDIYIVFTGLMQDDRNPKYIDELRQIITKYQLDSNILILGLIERTEQLSLMKDCLAVIQPSLFEGWGTVVEDAKTLGCNIVMSDIDVHYEQKVKNCLIFEKKNEKQLADMLIRIWDSKLKFEESNYDFKEKAKEYGKRFYDAIMCLEKG